ncbi:hypothetical protein NBT05_09920 [Aquimarina sp. ERC-38]|uniref:hypothetical protein n=1 Tax=Aquimarina sp. ERC-38 TaxID=2949996 RepID=UPI002246923E|nr:hypothetical protein [Aquimarina sp. ERC-38]UZO79287.1 hypothetical protein NBT05_09920 [Aquimarina sp. ERC-38]
MNGQKKYEREYRIQKTEFPVSAIDYLKQNNFTTCKIKYYLESDSTNQSYEAKFKYKDHRYSVEFNTNGILEDIEVNVDLDWLDKSLQEQIATRLDSLFKKHRILKVQVQYPNTEVENTTVIAKAAKTLDTSILHNYELLVAARKEDEGYSDYELLFDKKGNVLKIRKSVPPAYGYILY